MNKSQELEVQVMRAEIHADEVMRKYESAWHGAEAKEVEVPKQEQEFVAEEEDGQKNCPQRTLQSKIG